jgi:hypothetical protein
MRQRFWNAKAAWAAGTCAAALLLAGGCGSDGASATDTAGGTDSTVEDAGEDIPVVPECQQVMPTPFSTPIKVPGEDGQMITAKIKGTFLQPANCQVGSTCPLAIVVSDLRSGLADDPQAYPNYVEPASKMAGCLGINVVVFNLPGLGQGSYKSEGPANDVGGIYAEAAVKEMVLIQSSRESVDKKQVGFITIGAGLIPVTRAITVYSTGALKLTTFLLDVEGPLDRCSISEASENSQLSIGPSDGPGVSPTACNFNAAPQSAQYPPAQNGKSASIVCAEGAWPITLTGQKCSDNSWWTVREPSTYLKKVFQRYQRLQFKYDHRLPSHWASRIAIEKVASSEAKYFALNSMPECQAPVDDETCAALEAQGQHCWLEGDYGNGMAPAPYAGADFDEVTPEELVTMVLPGYLTRLLDPAKFPNCKG